MEGGDRDPDDAGVERCRVGLFRGSLENRSVELALVPLSSERSLEHTREERQRRFTHGRDLEAPWKPRAGRIAWPRRLGAAGAAGKESDIEVDGVRRPLHAELPREDGDLDVLDVEKRGKCPPEARASPHAVGRPRLVVLHAHVEEKAVGPHDDLIGRRTDCSYRRDASRWVPEAANEEHEREEASEALCRLRTALPPST